MTSETTISRPSLLPLAGEGVGAKRRWTRGVAASLSVVQPRGKSPVPTRADTRPARKRQTGFRDRAGFTLIEVTLALMLIAMLSALALPGLVRATGPSSLRIAALQVAALLREDRNVAVKTGYLVTSMVDSRDVRSGASRAAIALPVGTMAGVLGAPIQGVRFYADGHSSGGTIVIASASARMLVAVSPDTGAIRVDTP